VTSPEFGAPTDARAPRDASAPAKTRPIRGLSPADAIAVVLIAGIVGAFIEPEWPVGVLLVSAMAAVYGLFRVTRGLPLRHRALAMVAGLVAFLTAAGVLSSRGH
jgi:hypothetical protein